MSTHAQPRIPYAELAPKAFKSLYALSNAVHEASLGHRLVELVFLRVSQVNGCGYCVDMHWQALTKLDVDPRLLNAVAVWRITKDGRLNGQAPIVTGKSIGLPPRALGSL